MWSVEDAFIGFVINLSNNLKTDHVIISWFQKHNALNSVAFQIKSKFPGENYVLIEIYLSFHMAQIFIYSQKNNKIN